MRGPVVSELEHREPGRMEHDFLELLRLKRLKEVELGKPNRHVADVVRAAVVGHVVLDGAQRVLVDVGLSLGGESLFPRELLGLELLRKP